MTYTDLTSSTLVSASVDILNGVKTRSSHGGLSVGPLTSASSGVVAGLRGMEFALNEQATSFFVIPDRVDILVAPVLRLTLAPCTSEASKSCAFTFSSDTVTAGSTPVADTGAQSTSTADVALSATLGTMQLVDVTLSVDVWAATTVGTIMGKLKRTAIGAGTELTGDVSVMNVALVYTIER